MFFTRHFYYTLIISFSISIPSFGYRILIDPGHGGRDTGALAKDLTESDIAWAWSLELKKSLTENNFEVELSRNETRGLTLPKRLARLNQKKYDLIISLHANYILDSRAKGIEYYLAAPLDLEDQKLQLAHEEVQLIKGTKKTAPVLGSLNDEQKSQVTAIINDLEQQARIEKSLRIATELNRAWPGKIKQGPFDLLSHAESPAILIELGFLSNPTDLQNLKNPQFRMAQNTKIADVITQYFKNPQRPKNH